MNATEMNELMQEGGTLADLLCYVGSDMSIQDLRDLLDPDMADRRMAIQQEAGGNVTPKLARILQAMGEASTCWDSLEGAGVFQPQRAAAIAKTLYNQLGLTG